jgi:hypothetical protein
VPEVSEIAEALGGHLVRPDYCPALSKRFELLRSQFGQVLDGVMDISFFFVVWTLLVLLHRFLWRFVALPSI